MQQQILRGTAVRHLRTPRRGVNVIDTSIAESLGYEVVGETEIGAPGGPQITANIVKVPLIQVGDATIENAEWVTMDIIGFSGGMTQGVIGVGTFSDYLVAYDIGGVILAELLVSIDQNNHLISFQQSARKPVAANANKRRRLGVRFRGMPRGSVLTIASIDPDSLGEKAGLLPGDVLLTLNDKPTEQYSMSDLGILFGSSDPLTFYIERDGESKTIEIK